MPWEDNELREWVRSGPETVQRPSADFDRMWKKAQAESERRHRPHWVMAAAVLFSLGLSVYWALGTEDKASPATAGHHAVHEETGAADEGAAWSDEDELEIAIWEAPTDFLLVEASLDDSWTDGSVDESTDTWMEL